MTLVETLKDEIRMLSTTSPIFEIKIAQGGWQGTCLALEPLNKVNHHDHVTDEMFKTDTLKALAMHCSRESINTNTKSYSINLDGAMSNVYSEITRHISAFVGTTLGRDKEIYQWYDRYALKENALKTIYIEPMLALYRYLCVNADQNYRDYNLMSQKHKQNVIGILEFIYQRDAKPEHVPQPRKRARRRRK